MEALNYQDFLGQKALIAESVGRDIPSKDISGVLYDFQAEIVRWALRKGRAAIFADCGLGKTLMQLEWARHVRGTVLIVAPLSVAEQTINEAGKLLLPVRSVRKPDDIQPGINITNYEMIAHFIGVELDGLVLDESSILKSVDGKTRSLLLEHFTDVPWRLCCTATPCPNDIAELANHAQFLGVMQRQEMLASFFVHDQDGWRLRGHAQKAFYRWLASWSMALKSPADLGFDASAFALPSLSIEDVVVNTDWRRDGEMLPGNLKGITDRASVRKTSVIDRVAAAVALVASKQEIGYNNSNQFPTIKGSDDLRSPGLQQDILRVEQGFREGTSACLLSSEQTQDRQGQTPRLQPQMAGEESRTCSRLSGGEKGTEKCSPQGALCSKRGTEDTKESGSQAMAASQSSEAQSSTNQALRDDSGAVQGPADSAEGQMFDLRILRPIGPKDVSCSRSLPPERRNEGPALHELQYGTGQVSGQPSNTSGSSRLFGKQWLIWCGLNAEQEALERASESAGISYVSIHGKTPNSAKIERECEWRLGQVQVMITKPSVFGFGLNWQHCSTMIFLGLSDSYETYYQCIRRCWRYGQKQPVIAYVVVSDHETEIVGNVRRKEQEAERLSKEIIEAAKEYEIEELSAHRAAETFERKTYGGEGWMLHQGDCVEELRYLDQDSIDLSVFSPPFLALYTYSATERDLGNCKGPEEFFAHFRFVIDELLRVTKSGRLCCVHVAQVPLMLARDGVIGLRDFRGMVCEQFTLQAWIYHGEICIDRDPQAQAIRTHSKGLLFAQLKKDASWLRPALADYILVFRKPGENAVPIQPNISNDEWIKWARPVWYGINESRTLNSAEARGPEDDRHIVPLQLDTIERVIRLWSNPGETVLSPFAGIGSEGYESVRLGRQFVGIELKPLYAKTAARNIGRAITEAKRDRLF